MAVPRERLLKAQAEAQELKNAESKRELVTIVATERAWSDVLQNLRAGMLALQSRVAQRLPHLTRADKAVIEAEIRAVLTELSTIRPEPSVGGAEATPEAAALDLDRGKPKATRGRKRTPRASEAVAVSA